MATRRRAVTGLPNLPSALKTKLYKTGQTRGASVDEIYQNRVLRCNTVLVPYAYRHECLGKNQQYESGFIVLLSPDQYFGMADPIAQLAKDGLALGTNAVVFYQTRDEWNRYPRNAEWTVPTSRKAPLGGQFVARVPATTSGERGAKINLGFTTTEQQGLGIRVYEYANSQSIDLCRMQLEAFFWLCEDAETVAQVAGMTAEAVALRKRHSLDGCRGTGFLDIPRLKTMHILDEVEHTTCPLCLGRLTGQGFLDLMTQAEGRATVDMTVTEIGLFHMQELRMGVLNHRPYNLAWGHHHCNVVIKDSGIPETLAWMVQVIDRNIAAGRISQPLPQTTAVPTAT
ncbi:BstXI family restriction endonuclease [Aquincola sp. J276]|uniref:BstXI family restriction endonuclease n=1 Tax=Aquincola sp. J276 TaxID=2898432 RepID=UPI00215126C1|nr:BstXI family restriction endonuclease [Aquincola sp. J276]MCR5865681.1 BstXI family restriction endonuclease [Aquincola sp. J276]